MKIAFLILFAAVLTGCHGVRTVSGTAVKTVDSVETRNLRTETGAVSSMWRDFAMSLDSFDMWIEPAPILRPDSVAADTSPQYRIHLRANKATVNSRSLQNENITINAVASDTSVLQSHATDNTESSTESVAIAKPPDMTIVLIVLIVIIVVFLGKKILF